MKYGVEKSYVFFSVLFYVGIVPFIYLYAVDDNTVVWLVAESMALVGILCVGIPDTLINTEMGDINISIARAVLCLSGRCAKCRLSFFCFLPL